VRFELDAASGLEVDQPTTRNHRQLAIRIEPGDRSMTRAEQGGDLLGHRGEHHIGLRAAGDERRHAAQRGLLLGVLLVQPVSHPGLRPGDGGVISSSGVRRRPSTPAATSQELRR
jgi:hypothetical protein